MQMRQLRIDALTRRRDHLSKRVEGKPDGAAMHDRRERAGLRYALAIIDAATRRGVLDELEADALTVHAIPLRDASEEARSIARQGTAL